MTSNNGLNLLNTKDVKANNIYVDYDGNIINILDLFSQKDEINNVIGLPPDTLNTLQKLATALNNNPDFINYVNQQLLLKRNIVDSYDKNYINTLITNYYTKTETDTNLLLKSDKLTTYTKTEVDNALLLKQNKI